LNRDYGWSAPLEDLDRLVRCLQNLLDPLTDLLRRERNDHDLLCLGSREKVRIGQHPLVGLLKSSEPMPRHVGRCGQEPGERERNQPCIQRGGVHLRKAPNCSAVGVAVRDLMDDPS
jgi:hypothetical protein